jgi:adenosylhomocysteine nucleosidase
MTRIAIVSALHEELGALLRCMSDEVPVVHGGREFYVGTLDGHEVVAVLSRVGKLLAAEFGVARTVFTGTAGGLHERARVGDVVIASAVLQHDLDASPLFPRYEVPLYGVDRFHADADLSAALADAARSVLGEAAASPLADDALDAASLRAFGIVAPAVHTGLVVSGDRFVASAAESAALRQRLPDALAVEMEGAALGQVCHDMGMAFAVVRTISDRADDSAHVDFTRFAESVASRYTLAIIRRCLRDLGGAGPEAPKPDAGLTSIKHCN